MKSSSPASGPPSPKGEGTRFPLWGEWRAVPREVTAFPFGEGGGAAVGRGHCLPLRGRWRRSRRKRSLPSPLGKVAAQPSEEVKNLIIYLDNIHIVFVFFQFPQEVLSLNRNKSRRSYPAPLRFFLALPSAAREFYNFWLCHNKWLIFDEK